MHSLTRSQPQGRLQIYHFYCWPPSVRSVFVRVQALTYSLALLRHWNGLPSNYVALIDVDEYIVIDQPKACNFQETFPCSISNIEIA